MSAFLIMRNSTNAADLALKPILSFCVAYSCRINLSFDFKNNRLFLSENI